MQRLKSFLLNTPFSEFLGRSLLMARNKFFDIRHGINTDGNIQLRELNIKSSNVTFGFFYEAIDPKLFNRIMKSFEIRPEGFVFVDFGSGKGRVLFMASEYPFKEIVGVEFSPELHAVAQNNIRKYKSGSQKCKEVKSVCMDAINYPIPEDPVILFFNSPFTGEVLAPVLANIQKSMEKHPREVFIVYVHPRFDHLMQSNAALIKIASSPWHSLYKGVRG